MNFRITTLLWACSVLVLVAISLQQKIFEQQQRIEQLSAVEKIATESAGYFETRSADKYLVRCFRDSHSPFEEGNRYRVRVPDISRVKLCSYQGQLAEDALPKPDRKESFAGTGPGYLIVASGTSKLGATTFHYAVTQEDTDFNFKSNIRSAGVVGWAKGEPQQESLRITLIDGQQAAEYPTDEPLILAKEVFQDTNGKTSGFVIWLEYE